MEFNQPRNAREWTGFTLLMVAFLVFIGWVVATWDDLDSGVYGKGLLLLAIVIGAPSLRAAGWAPQTLFRRKRPELRQ